MIERNLRLAAEKAAIRRDDYGRVAEMERQHKLVSFAVDIATRIFEAAPIVASYDPHLKGVHCHYSDVDVARLEHTGIVDGNSWYNWHVIEPCEQVGCQRWAVHSDAIINDLASLHDALLDVARGNGITGPIRPPITHYHGVA